MFLCLPAANRALSGVQQHAQRVRVARIGQGVNRLQQFAGAHGTEHRCDIVAELRFEFARAQRILRVAFRKRVPSASISGYSTRVNFMVCPLAKVHHSVSPSTLIWAFAGGPVIGNSALATRGRVMMVEPEISYVPDWANSPS